MPRRRFAPYLWALSLTLAAPVPAAESFDLGLRAGIALADGEPANDIPGFGLFGHWRVNERWQLGFALETAEYDFEQPARLVGVRQDPSAEVVDAKAEGTTVSAWLERRVGPATPRGHWFWGAGVGLASIDVPDARGPVAGGGLFDVETDAGSEVVVSLLGGRRTTLGERWALDLALHVDQHFADWQVRDRVSGRRGAVGDYLTYGGSVGFAYRWPAGAQ